MKVLKSILTLSQYIVLVLGIGLALYVSIWIMFIKPIIAVAIMFDIGTFTWVMVAKTVISCILAGAVGMLILLATGIIVRIIEYVVDNLK